MTTAGAMALLIGTLCVWPFVTLMIGIFIGRTRLRLRSPFVRGDKDEYGE
jgi:hypothetical protein